MVSCLVMVLYTVVLHLVLVKLLHLVPCMIASHLALVCANHIVINDYQEAINIDISTTFIKL